MNGSEQRGSIVVEVVFHVSDEQHGRTVAAQMIDRAHEIANLPECECDLDVNVRWSAPAPVSGHRTPSASGSPPPSAAHGSSPPPPPAAQQSLE